MQSTMAQSPALNRFPHVPPGVIPELRARSKLWVQPGVVQNPKPNKQAIKQSNIYKQRIVELFALEKIVQNIIRILFSLTMFFFLLF